MTFRKLIALIEKRPLTFLSHCSLAELEAFINGYNFHKFVMGEVENIDEEFKEFIDSWIYSRIKIIEKQGWKEAILGSSKNEAEAFERFFELWNEFLSQRNKDPEQG